MFWFFTLGFLIAGIPEAITGWRERNRRRFGRGLTFTGCGIGNVTARLSQGGVPLFVGVGLALACILIGLTLALVLPLISFARRHREWDAMAKP